MLVINRDRRDAQRDEQLQCINYRLNLDLKLQPPAERVLWKLLLSDV